MENPIKPTIKTEIFSVILLSLSFIASFYFYSHFPERVPIHWNLKGEIDNWGSAGFAAFFFPILILGIYAMFLTIPLLDPKKDRYIEFKQVFHLFKNFMVSFMVVIYFISSLNGLGYDLPIGTFIPLMVGLLFIAMGNYMGKLKLNWFMGARNPWTLSNEEVWNKTNRLTGKVFVASGFLMMLEAFMPIDYKLPLFIVIIASLVLIPNIYSFIIYKKINK